MFYFPQYAPIPTLKKNTKNVIHQTICPVCGRKNVNIYWQSHHWQCRVCCILEKKLEEVRNDEDHA